jgi:16S rRNA (cytosine1402-N4)-methyltransferase
MQTEYHATVMGPEAVAWIAPAGRRILVDATAGHGGHAHLMASQMDRGGLLVLVDAQRKALETAQRRVEQTGVAVLAIQGNFRHLPELLRTHGIEEVDGVLYDQGLSSADLSSDLGFSFRHDAPLDMRRSPDARVSAAELLATLDVRALTRLFRELGEEPWAARIAGAIVRERQRQPIERTAQLVRIIEDAVPRRAWPRDIHVATRCMMGLRYAVNQDLEAITESILGVVPMMSVGARCVCISFCSLEDRAVKQAMRSLEHPCICPRDLPVCVCNRRPVLRMLTRKPVRPSEAEVAANRRSRSALMRVGERI